jgi:hypothetical protein
MEVTGIPVGKAAMYFGSRKEMIFPTLNDVGSGRGLQAALQGTAPTNNALFSPLSTIRNGASTIRLHI